MPPTAPTPHRTPLRRLSQGSLSRLSRSGAYPDAPHGLGFLEPALSELLDEVETLQSNVGGLHRLSDALSTFNESFASWIYVMNMHALTTDWLQAPTDASFKLAARRADEDAKVAMEALLRAQNPPSLEVAEASDMDKTTYDTDGDADITFNPNATAGSSTAASTSTIPKGILKKKGKPKLTNKEKKERSLAVERIVSALPLEFRGNDPNLRRHIELVIEGFFDRDGRGVAMPELVKPPDLSQARVNKCLIALVNRKVVRKDNSTGSVLYHWHGLPG